MSRDLSFQGHLQSQFNLKLVSSQLFGICLELERAADVSTAQAARDARCVMTPIAVMLAHHRGAAVAANLDNITAAVIADTGAMLHTARPSAGDRARSAWSCSLFACQEQRQTRAEALAAAMERLAWIREGTAYIDIGLLVRKEWAAGSAVR